MDFKTLTHYLFQTLDISYILKSWCALRKERLVPLFYIAPRALCMYYV